MNPPEEVPDIQTAYRRYFPTIREKCARILRDPEAASDVAQETFIRLWRATGGRSPPKETLKWIYRTSTRLAIDHLRSQRVRERYSADEEHGDSVPAPSRLEARTELLQWLELAANAIPRDELELALLERVDGLSQAELAEVAGVSERTVRRQLQRFERRLESMREVRR